jgi:hypothetical protein
MEGIAESVALRWATKDVDLALAEAGDQLPPPWTSGDTLVEAAWDRPTSVP